MMAAASMAPSISVDHINDVLRVLITTSAEAAVDELERIERELRLPQGHFWGFWADYFMLRFITTDSIMNFLDSVSGQRIARALGVTPLMDRPHDADMRGILRFIAHVDPQIEFLAVAAAACIGDSSLFAAQLEIMSEAYASPSTFFATA